MYYRFIVLFFSFLCLMSIFANYNIINFTFICMRDDPNSISTDSNGIAHNLFDYSSGEKSGIIWAVAIGTVFGTFPINWLYIKYGARYTFLFSGIISCITTLLIPISAYYNYKLLLFFRFLQGVTYAADFAVIGIICVKWAPLDENAFFVSILTSFSPFATSITDSLTGFLCTSSLGWTSSFYFHGFGGIVCFLLWFLIYSDSPTNHSMISSQELHHIEKGKSSSYFQVKRNIPYLEILKSPAILCCWFNAFMDLSMSIMILTYSPIYFNRVLQFPIEQTGYIISITNFAQIPFKLIAAAISDKCRIISPLSKMLIFNTISCGVVAILFSFVGFVSNPWIAMFLITLVNCLMSTNCGGYYQCSRYVAQQYSDVVISAIQFCKVLALFFVPTLIAFFVHDETDRTQWAMAFCVNSGFLFVASISAYFLFTEQPAQFTKERK